MTQNTALIVGALDWRERVLLQVFPVDLTDW